jgi:hypothetical protein
MTIPVTMLEKRKDLEGHIALLITTLAIVYPTDVSNLLTTPIHGKYISPDSEAQKVA